MLNTASAERKRSRSKETTGLQTNAMTARILQVIFFSKTAHIQAEKTKMRRALQRTRRIRHKSKQTAVSMLPTLLLQRMMAIDEQKTRRNLILHTS